MPPISTPTKSGAERDDGIEFQSCSPIPKQASGSPVLGQTKFARKRKPLGDVQNTCETKGHDPSHFEYKRLENRERIEESLYSAVLAGSPPPRSPILGQGKLVRKRLSKHPVDISNNANADEDKEETLLSNDGSTTFFEMENEKKETSDGSVTFFEKSSVVAVEKSLTTSYDRYVFEYMRGYWNQ